VGRRKKATNESSRLVGGGNGRRWLAWDDVKKPPTSHQDSLVVETGSVGVRQRKTINESL